MRRLGVPALAALDRGQIASFDNDAVRHIGINSRASKSFRRDVEQIDARSSGPLMSVISVDGKRLVYSGAGGIRTVILEPGQYKDYPIGSDGRFEIPGFFPGSYTLDVTSTRLLLGY